MASSKRRRPADFGSGSRRSRTFASPGVTVALAIIMGAAVAVGTWLQQEPVNIANARRWTISGPPCRTITARAFAASIVKVRLRFEYDDLTFERAFGHVYCDEIHDDGGRGLSLIHI